MKAKALLRVAGACAGVVLIVSCALFRPSERDPRSVSGIPDDYGHAPEGGPMVSERWWEAFNDAELTRVVEDTLRRNISLDEAAARLAQARALARQKGASRLPELDLEASAGSTRFHEEDSVSGDDTQTFETYSLGLFLSYELDLWGRVDANARSAGLAASASRADLETAAMSLSAESAIRYFELIATRQTIDLLDRQIETNTQINELIELRFRRSQATALDVLQQRGILARTEALAPPLKGREGALVHELLVLQGRPPSAPTHINARELPEPPPVPETGLSADLVSRRPDVRAAWLRLTSADWGVAAARADRMPAIRLTASGKYEGESVESLFDNWLLNLAANLTAPLFDAGLRKAEVERQRAVVEERVAAYRLTALTALREVQDALARENAQIEHLSVLERQLDLSVKSREQAMKRYGRGQESYLRVLAAIEEEDLLRRSIVQAEYERLVYRVQLYRALGGDWSAILDETKTMNEPGPDEDESEK